jgi:hypothetical protein
MVGSDVDRDTGIMIEDLRGFPQSPAKLQGYYIKLDENASFDIPSKLQFIKAS